MRLRRLSKGNDRPINHAATEAAAKARVQSERELVRTRQDWGTVRAASDLLRQHREQNGFSDLIVQTFKET